MNREIKIRKYEPADIPSMVQIWNEVVEEGVAFPQENFLTDESGADFFAAQTYCGGCRRDIHRSGAGTLYSPSQQHWQMRTSFQCKLRCRFFRPRTTHR